MKNNQNCRRVLFINHAAVLGGGELSLIDLASAYAKTSEVLLFADGPLREYLEAKGVKVQISQANQSILNVKTNSKLKALKASPALLLMARQVAKRSKNFDLIHANSQKAFIVAALARFFGSPPVVWHLRDILTAKHFSTLNRRLAITLANKNAAAVLVNSHATGEAFVKAGGRGDLVKLVYDGLASEPFEQVDISQVAAIRTELGLGNEPLVGIFSRLSYWKGQHIFLEALEQLPLVHGLLVGDALFGEEEYTSQLKTQAASSELVNRIHWLGFRDDIPVLMKACNIIVHASTEPEPFGRVIIEGQLAKRPVVAAAGGGAIELIEDGITGCLVPPNNTQALKQAIQNLLWDKEAANTMAAQGYLQAKTNFSLEALLNTFDEAINSI